MIPPAFDYAAPTTLGDAISMLTQHPEAKILAGGHSLIPMLKFRMANPALLIDINKIDGLAYLKEEDGWLKIGAMTRESMIDHSSLIAQRYPLLADAAKMIADPIVRNMATVGGNLAHADPANDHPAVMLAYRAEIVITGAAGQREVPIDEFFTGPFSTVMEPNEILTEIRIPTRKAGDGGCYLKIERKVGDYATVAVGVQVHVNADGTCDSAGIALTNMGLTAIRASAAEAALVGTKLDAAVVKAAAQAASDVAEPVSDWRGTEAYKRSLVRTLVTRALRQAVERAAN